MARVLLVGTATLDLVFDLDHHPGADEEMRASGLRTCRGGNAANSAVVLAGLGHAPEFLGVLADAPETSVIERDFAAYGVGYGHCPRMAGKPPTSSIYLSGGKRSIVHYRDLPELAAEYFLAMDLAGFDWLHFEGRNVPQLAAMLDHVRVNYPALSISVELEKPRDGIEHLLDKASLLLCSHGMAGYFGHKEPQAFLAWMAEQAPRADVVVAWGEGGAYGKGVRSAVSHAPAIPPPRLVDTLGAGDTFNAGMIDARLRGFSMEDALAAACRLAGIKCGMYGFDVKD